MKLVFGRSGSHGKERQEGEMTPFQSLATAIAAQVGTGNLTGAATALISGGPGAIFWMWLSAFFGMATIYAEATLAQKYKTTEDGEVTGGPVYYIRQAFQGTFGKVLACLFAVFIILALGFMGNMVQSNSIGAAFNEVFTARGIPVPPVAVGVVLAVIAFVIFVGGTKRLASVVEKMVPFMAVIYIVGSLVLIGMNITAVPEAFRMIFVGAFQPKAVAGGMFGMTVKEAIRYGVARGLFSNEAGMGSTPHAHARAAAKNPHEQGLRAMISVFIDTFIIPEPDRVLRAHHRCALQRQGRDCPDPGGVHVGIWQLRRYFRGHLPAVFRLLHDPGLAFLRGDQCEVPLRQEGGEGIFRVCGGLYHHRLHAEGGPGVGAGRFLQRPDGDPQRPGPAGVKRPCGGNLQDVFREKEIKLLSFQKKFLYNIHN